MQRERQRLIRRLGTLAVIGASAFVGLNGAKAKNSSPSTYIVRDDASGRWGTRIDFFEHKLAFSHKDNTEAERSQSDAGGSLRYIADDQAYYILDQPISVPKRNVTAWTTDKYRCRAKHLETTALITCTSLATGRAFSSLHSWRRGIEWFDYFCASYSTEICRYEIRSKLGLLNRDAAQRVSTSPPRLTRR